MPSTSTFEKYGGFASLYPLVGSFYDAVLDSEVVSYMFDSVDMPRLIEHQTKFIAAIMGGPGKYDDQLLRSAHNSLNISEIEWSEVVKLLTETLHEFEFEEEDIDAVIERINSKKHLIVSGEQACTKT